jgi:hypothetical protein
VSTRPPFGPCSDARARNPIERPSNAFAFNSACASAAGGLKHELACRLQADLVFGKLGPHADRAGRIVHPEKTGLRLPLCVLTKRVLEGAALHRLAERTHFVEDGRIAAERAFVAGDCEAGLEVECAQFRRQGANPLRRLDRQSRSVSSCSLAPG